MGWDLGLGANLQEFPLIKAGRQQNKQHHVGLQLKVEINTHVSIPITAEAVGEFLLWADTEVSMGDLWDTLQPKQRSGDK